MRRLNVLPLDAGVVLEDDELDCIHEYPIDWRFGGADECDPRADERFMPASYAYYDENLDQVWITSSFVCEEAALDAFTFVRDTLKCRPKYIMTRRPGESVHTIMPWVYSPETDEVRKVEQ